MKGDHVKVRNLQILWFRPAYEFSSTLVFCATPIGYANEGCDMYLYFFIFCINIEWS